MMQLLLNHWHCILPAAAIIISLIFMSRDNKKTKSQNQHADRKTPHTKNDKEQQENV